ncbi:hypothetical protein ACLBX9_07080 [Methylobacterium sp. A49B]
MPQESLIPELDELIIVERVAPDEEALIKFLVRQAVPWVPAEAHHPVVVVTATEHDDHGVIRAEVILFDGGRAALWIPQPLVPGAPQRVWWLDSDRQIPFGFDHGRGIWRRYPELALAAGDAREAIVRLDVEEAGRIILTEKRRDAALRGAETRRRNRLAREKTEGGGGRA